MNFNGNLAEKLDFEYEPLHKTEYASKTEVDGFSTTNVTHEVKMNIKLNTYKKNSLIIPPKEDILLGEKIGTILRKEKGFIEVEFDNGILANLPDSLFIEQKKISMGQSFKYMIMKRGNDFKYEKIEYIDSKSESNKYYNKFKKLFEGSEFV